MTLVRRLVIQQNRLVSKAKRTKSVRATRIGYDLEDPITRERAIAEICAAFDQSHGSAREAATRLEVKYLQVMRWLDRTPELRKKVNDIRYKYGNAWADEPVSGS